MMRKAEYWRERAKEARVEMEYVKDPQARKIMARVVKYCEELAELAEKRALLEVRTLDDPGRHGLDKDTRH